MRWCIESGRVVEIDNSGVDERLAMARMIIEKEVIDDEILQLIADKTDGKIMDELEEFISTYLISMKYDFHIYCDKFMKNIDNIDNMYSQRVVKI